MARTALVVGSTGSQGRPTALALLEAGWQVRAVTRSAGRAADLVALGAEAVEADLRDPASLRAAAEGADAAYFHLPMSVAGPQGGHVEAAALQALADGGVGHLVVNVGMALPDEPIGVPMLDGRVAAVRALLEQGATVLMPTGYMENFAAAWSRPHVVAGELRYPRPADDPIAWVTSDDVGAATVGALAAPERSRGARYRLAGPEVLTFEQVAATLGEVLGRPVVFRQITGAEYAEMIAPVLGEQLAAGIGAGYDQMPPFPNPLMAPDTTPAREELGVTFTPLAAWAARQDWAAPAD
jgi:uncharacterized protein YbjT (DUF2867 family)